MFTGWQLKKREELYRLNILSGRENDKLMPKIYTSPILFLRYPLGGLKQIYWRLCGGR